ncbi:MAG: hypothetical protein AAFQ36_07440 [Pseudomonadota bacterium]
MCEISTTRIIKKNVHLDVRYGFEVKMKTILYVVFLLTSGVAASAQTNQEAEQPSSERLPGIISRLIASIDGLESQVATLSSNVTSLTGEVQDLREQVEVHSKTTRPYPRFVTTGQLGDTTSCGGRFDNTIPEDCRVRAREICGEFGLVFINIALREFPPGGVICGFSENNPGAIASPLLPE